MSTSKIFENLGKTIPKCQKYIIKIFQATKKNEISLKWNHEGSLGQMKHCLSNHDGLVDNTYSKVLFYHHSSRIFAGVHRLADNEDASNLMPVT